MISVEWFWSLWYHLWISETPAALFPVHLHSCAEHTNLQNTPTCQHEQLMSASIFQWIHMIQYVYGSKLSNNGQHERSFSDWGAPFMRNADPYNLWSQNKPFSSKREHFNGQCARSCWRLLCFVLCEATGFLAKQPAKSRNKRDSTKPRTPDVTQRQTDHYLAMYSHHHHVDYPNSHPQEHFQWGNQCFEGYHTSWFTTHLRIVICAVVSNYHSSSNPFGSLSSSTEYA